MEKKFIDHIVSQRSNSNFSDPTFHPHCPFPTAFLFLSFFSWWAMPCLQGRWQGAVVQGCHFRRVRFCGVTNYPSRVQQPYNLENVYYPVRVFFSVWFGMLCCSLYICSYYVTACLALFVFCRVVVIQWLFSFNVIIGFDVERYDFCFRGYSSEFISSVRGYALLIPNKFCRWQVTR